MLGGGVLGLGKDAWGEPVYKLLDKVYTLVHSHELVSPGNYWGFQLFALILPKPLIPNPLEGSPLIF